MTDLELLRESRSESEHAFEEIVKRYSRLVYSSALRRLDQDHALAQDVTQSVFIILHRKLHRFSDEVPLAGWLLKTTSFVARRAMSARFRRQRMEAELLRQVEWSMAEDPAPLPFLDDALMSLKPHEQRCISQRFLANASLKEIADLEQISEDAAQKRVARALEKLRSYLVRRGVGVAAVSAIAASLAESAKGVPPEFSSSIVSSVSAAETGQAASGGALLARLAMGSLWRRQLAVAALKVCIILGIVSPMGWWIYSQRNALPAGRRPAPQTAAAPVSVASLAQQWSGLVRRAAALVQTGPPPANSTQADLYQQQLNAVYSECARVMGDLYSLLSAGKPKPLLTEFFTLELAENLQLNAAQQSSVSNLVSSVLPEGQDAQAGFKAIVQNKDRMIPQIQGLLSEPQKQRFDSIYRSDGMALFTVATLSVDAQQQK